MVKLNNITRTDPIRVRFQSDEQIRNLKLFGTVVSGYRDIEGADPIHDWFVSIKTSPINPHNPELESNNETIDKVLEQMNVVSDRVRTKEKDYFKADDKTDCEWKLKVDEKKFSKDNRYDTLIDRLEFNSKYKDKIVGKVKY